MFQIPSLFPDLFVYKEIAPFILRLILAFIFIGHGYSKLKKSPEQTAQFFDSMGIRPGKFWTHLVGFSELASGILLLIGLFVQAAAIAIVLIIIIAILKVKRKEAFWGGYEFDLLILAVALALLFLGPGIFSFDLPL